VSARRQARQEAETRSVPVAGTLEGSGGGATGTLLRLLASMRPVLAMLVTSSFNACGRTGRMCGEEEEEEAG